MTNRELYRAVEEIAERYKLSDRSLEHYLLALLALVLPHRPSEAMPIDVFV